ncbi:MAG: class I SAM-dependent RNA methyltransferase [Oscillospiraceae bacterium]
MSGYKLVCPCLLGVEGLVADELRAEGLTGVVPENGRVIFDGTPEGIARANINSRYSERVLILLGTFAATSFEELFQGVKALPWDEFIGKTNAFPVKGRSLSSKLTSIPDCQSIIKKAVVEQLKSRYHIDWFSEEGPTCQIQFLIFKNKVSVMIDTSGPGLHKRGYRQNATEAPIKETLAASMARLARVRPDGNFIDPFCGSGTILIEAATYAMHIAPGIRRRFAAENSGIVGGRIWELERSRAHDLIQKDTTFQAVGFDIDDEALALTLENAKKAGVASRIRTEKRDIRDFKIEGEYGCVICNPPYGERLLDVRQAQELYKQMGSVFESRHGWSYTMISPDEEFEKCFGREADRRRKLYNGMLKCQVYMYYK